MIFFPDVTASRNLKDNLLLTFPFPPLQLQLHQMQRRLGSHVAERFNESVRKEEK
jgi:hypothetical protein